MLPRLDTHARHFSKDMGDSVGHYKIVQNLTNIDEPIPKYMRHTKHLPQNSGKQN